MKKLIQLFFVFFLSVSSFGQTGNAQNFDDDANAAMLLPAYSDTLHFSDAVWRKTQDSRDIPRSIMINSQGLTRESSGLPQSHKRINQTLNPICGTKNIGPTGDYVSLTDAFTALSDNGISCVVNLILQPAYLSSVETFPIQISSIPGSNDTNKVNVYPSSSGLTITSSNVTGTINLNGVKYVCFDGRVNATGSIKDLVIENTSTSGYAIQFINSASNNTIQYCIAKGASTLITNGVISFDMTTETSGNNNNLIDNCEICAGVSSPLYAIYSRGSVFPSAYNSNNTVSNCLIHDFYAPGGGNPVGIALYASTTWTISGNSFYMTTPKNPLIAVGYNIIFIASGDGYSILNNFIGGTAPNCGGSPFTLNGNGTPAVIANFFYGIRFAGGNNINPSLVQGNTISNISLFTRSSSPGAILFVGIFSAVGIQDINNNVIGSATGTGSISIDVSVLNSGGRTSTYEGIDFRGLRGNITNNVFGSFTISGPTGSSAFTAMTVMPITVTSGAQNGTINISGNLIGSLTTANSIQTSVLNYPPVYIQSLYAFPVGSGNLFIENNTITNISNWHSFSGSYLKGIWVSTSVPTLVAGNTIRDMTSNTTNGNSTGNVAVQGIHIQNQYTTSIIRSNNIYNLTNTAISAATGIHGIFTIDVTGSLLIEKNFIHNLGLSTTSVSAAVYGIMLYQVTNSYITAKNNMIQLGINPDGSANTSGCRIFGILATNARVDSILYNSVYIGGTPALATGNTYAYSTLRTPSLLTKEVCIGNIFFNGRSGGTTGKHYAIDVNGTSKFPLGFTGNYNLIIANGATGGTFGRFNNTDCITFAAYKDATGTEMASGSGNPNFIAPTGNSSTANLHISNPTTVEGAGIALASVTDDFDGNARNGLTPSDVGADAGNFTFSTDVFGPNITCVPIGNGTIANRTLPNWATITDNVGVAGGANIPRIYYKKASDANVFVGNTSNDNGWKYTLATNISSPYSFTIDYSIIFSGSVSANDIIQYFVVAQDAANNLSSNYPMAGSGAVPPVQNINACPAIATIQTYMIVANTIPTTITVPGTYATLTGAGGAFDMINMGVLTGNTTINITADLTEPGTVALNTLSEDMPGANYTLLIKPDATTLRTISGTTVASATAMIRTNGTCRFTIDGGAGKLLTFRNTNAVKSNTGPTMQFNNSSQGVFVKNCTIENNGSTTTRGSIDLGGTGINIVEISGNDIRNATADTPGNMATGIYNSNMANSVKVLNNNIYNFISYGLYFTNAADGVIITGNSFYYNSITATGAMQYCIWLAGGMNNNTISDNYFGGGAPMCAGNAWTNSSGFSFYAMNLTLGIMKHTTISNNTISNINMIAGGFYGMNITAGLVNIQNNMIGSTTVPGSITFAGISNFFGAYLSLSTGMASSIQGNTFAGLNFTNPAAVQVMLLAVANGLVKIGDVAPNTFGSNTTAGSITYAGTGIVYGLWNFSSIPGNIVENNIIGNWTLTGTVGSPTVRGLYIYSADVRKNKIFNISATGTNLTPTIVGIYNFGAPGVTNEYSNNIVSLDGGLATNPLLFGFYGASFTNSFYNLYYNDFYISGPPTGTSNTSAFYREVAGFYTLKNNIFANLRAAGGTGKHYAAYILTTGELNSDNNNLYSLAGPLGFYNAADQMTLALWKTAIGGDANSQNVDPQFTSSIDLHTIVPQLHNTGISIPAVNTDYSGIFRGNPPDLGAYEGPAAPIVITTSATAVSGSEATMNGTVNANTLSTTVTFEYGLTTAYGTTLNAYPYAVAGTVTTSVSAILAGLLPNTTYHYRVIGTSIGGTTNGNDMEFTTSSVQAVVVTNFANPVGSNTSTLNGTVNANNAATTVSFQWGPTAAYGNTSNAIPVSITGMIDTAVVANLSGLMINATYHFRCVGINSAGTAYGLDQSFTTNCVAPVITINGPVTACTGVAGYVYATESGNTSYNWNISAGGIITAGSGTNSITVKWNTTGTQSVSVNYNNQSGCSASVPAAYNVNVSSTPSPTISGPAMAGTNYPGYTYSTETGMNNYIWTISPGGAITSGQGTNAISVTWNSAGAQSVSVTYTNSNGCAAFSPTIQNTTVYAAPVISGANVVCQTTEYQDYTTEPGMTNYVWNMSPNSGTITQSSTNVVTIFWTSPGAKWVSVSYTNANGFTNPSPSFYNVTVNPLPGTPGIINGPQTICAGAVNIAFSVASVPNANTYNWALPAGASIASGSGTNAIAVNFGQAASPGNISVMAQNACGDGPSSPALTIAVSTIPSAAGAIAGIESLCQGSTGIIYTVPAIANATSYSWTVPAGASIVTGSATNAITVNFSLSATSGIISVNGVNDCGSGIASSNFGVVVNPIPATPVITQHFDTLTSSANTGNQWYLNGVIIPGATGKQHVAVYTGTYTVVVTVNECSSLPSNGILVLPVSVTVEKANRTFEIYPNPNTGEFNIKVETLTSEVFNIEIYNSLGSLIWKQENVTVNGTFTKHVVLTDSPSGMYMVKLRNNDNTIVKKLIIKN